MSTNGAVAPAPKRSFRHVWLPWLIIGVPALYVAGIWAWPGDNLVESSRRFGTNVAIVAAVLLFWAWGVWVSKYRRWFLVAGCVIAGVLAVTIERFECTGGMNVLVRTRFDKHDEILAAHRESQKSLVAAAVATTSPNNPLDYPAYRGRNRDGIVAGPPLARDWNLRPPRCLWRQPVGGGYAQFAVAGNAAVTIEQRRDQEAVVCYDTETGIERWKHAYPARFNEVMGGEGPRATPTIADGAVYSLGAIGMLACLDLATGQHRWSVNILEGNKNVRWGMSGSPLVFDQVVVVNPGAQTDSTKGRALVAYDRKTGDVVWTAGAAGQPEARRV
jgi:outer membrane protein assembly factor BamB